MMNQNCYGLTKAIPGLLFFGMMIQTAFSTTPAVRGILPSVVHESSGLAFTGGSSFWTHNDGYGDENLYKISNTGALTRTVEILGATNRDWEDIAQDRERNFMFIGDFGNNANDRTNLKIYKIQHPSNTSASTITAEEISFSYPDQNRFPPSWMNFDAEAMLHFNGKLYIFTKPVGSAVGYTKMYSLPDMPGTYVATLVDSFYTNDRPTGADISPDGRSMILMANSRLHLFRNFSGDDFFGGQYTKISITGGWTQKEAISFSSNNEIYLTDESSSNSKLYYIDMSPWIPQMTTTDVAENVNREDVIVLPNPASSYFNVQISSPEIDEFEMHLFDLTGKEVLQLRAEKGSNALHVRTGNLPAGIYFYKLVADRRVLRTDRLIISH